MTDHDLFTTDIICLSTFWSKHCCNRLEIKIKPLMSFQDLSSFWFQILITGKRFLRVSKLVNGFKKYFCDGELPSAEFNFYQILIHRK